MTVKKKLSQLILSLIHLQLVVNSSIEASKGKEVTVTIFV